MKDSNKIRKFTKSLTHLQKLAIKSGLNIVILKELRYICDFNPEVYLQKRSNRNIVFAVIFIFISIVLTCYTFNSLLNSRCLLSSNYLVWETTRPISDCSYCLNVTKPIILKNVTRESFQKFDYASKPIIVKKAVAHWKAIDKFDFNFFKELYEQTTGSYESVDETCQFLTFKTDLFSLKEVFTMPESRALNQPGEKPWYIGWGNCHPDILRKVRQYYEYPKFLPEDAEFPAAENIFFGYEIGAVMHLDYIPRLMWQGQVRGNKSWIIAPVLECEQFCTGFEFYVEPGDIVLLDTRLWYHATKIPKGEFSITVQSEYG